MENYKSLSSSGLFGLFFSLQAFGYLHGSEIFGSARLENTVAFGIYHLANVFEPHGPFAWPLSPLLCGLLLIVTPFLESGSKNTDKRFNDIYICLMIPLSLSILEVSIIGPAEAAYMVHGLHEFLGSPVLVAILYLGVYLLLTGLCWRYIHVIKYRTESLTKMVPRELLGTIVIIWLLYGCYEGARFDGALDKLTVPHERSLIHKFFPEEDVVDGGN